MKTHSRFAMAVAAGIVFASCNASAAPAQNPLTVHSFCSQPKCADGQDPFGGLVRGADGAFYGITAVGGVGFGVIYRITSTGKYSVLHTMMSRDGNVSEASLTLGRDGNLYGTAPNGGTYSDGTVFQISPTGSFAVLHDFSGDDGFDPTAPPIEDSQGNWYGTTDLGGLYNHGTIYEISADGVFHVLHDFTGDGDGDEPVAALVLASDGNFYGTTIYGGANGVGTVFRMTPTGTLTTLHVFSLADGVNPSEALVQGPGGALYGTTIGGGIGELMGTVFRITLAGRFKTLHFFDGETSSSGFPVSALTLMPDGYFYGEDETTSFNGEIYRISPKGEFSQVYVFTGANGEGYGPHSTLVRGPGGSLYGTAPAGGKYLQGTVFRYLPPPTQ